MTSKLTVRMGGGIADPIVDYTPQSPFWDIPGGQTQISGGNQWDNGGCSQGEAIIIDDVGEIPRADDTKNLAGHNLVLWTEDAPAACPLWLSHGRRNTAETSRGDNPWGDSQTLHFTWDDANWELRGLDIDGDAYPNGWSRPSETDVARATALITTFCQRSPRYTTYISTDLIVNANTVTMPAKVYPPGTALGDILADCATTAGKGFGVVINHSSGEPSGSTAQKVRFRGDYGYGGATKTQSFTVEGSGTYPDGMLYTIVSTRGSQQCTGVTWKPDAGNSGLDQAYTQIGTEVTTGSPASRVTRWRLLNPRASAGGGVDGQIQPTLTGGNAASAEATWYLYSVNQTTPINASATGTTGGTSISDAISAGANDLVIDGLGWCATHSAALTAVPGSGQTQDYQDGRAGAFGDPDEVLAVSDKVGATAMAWSSIPSSADYHGAAHIADAIAGDNATVGCSHLSLLYTIPDDYTTFASTAKISVDPADIAPLASPPVFPPIWDQGPAQIADGSDRPVTKIISGYTSGTATAYATATNSSLVALYDYYAMGINDSVAVNSTQATTRASAVLASLNKEHITGQVTVQVRDDQVNLISAGMPIQVKGYGGGQYIHTYQNRRIVSLKWEMITPAQGSHALYLAHMQLDRAPRLVPGTTSGGGGVGAGGPGTGSSASLAANSNAAAIAALTTASANYMTKTGGADETVNTIAASGASQTLNLALGNWQLVTLTANCTFTFSGATAGKGDSFYLRLTQDGTGSRTVTWPGSVVWPGGTAPTLSTAAGAVDEFVFESSDGGTTWYGHAAGGGGSALTIKDEGSALSTATTSIDFVGAGVTASGTGAAKTVTIPGSTGPLLIADTHSTPLVFADILQTEAGDDFLYSG